MYFKSVIIILWSLFYFTEPFGIIIPNIIKKTFKSIINNKNKEQIVETQKIYDYPKLDYSELSDQDKYDLQWYVVGIDSEFTINKPEKITVWNKNYVVWKTIDGSYVALDDVCSHKSASLSQGKICNNKIVCPYHGYEFNETGTLTTIPGINFHPSPIFFLSKYKIVEKNGWVYLNTYSDIRVNSTDDSVKTNLFEEEVSRNDSVVFLKMDFKCYSRILTENSLDIMHIGFVHTFGNTKNPAPVEEYPPKMVAPHHFKTSYKYESGHDSLARKCFTVSNLTVENEFILPHTTVARIIFGNYVNTVVTFALPVTEEKSILFVKTYRNFWKNGLGDRIFRNMMYKTMLQDRIVIESIDNRFLDGKFNMRFDKLQNTYTTFYKRFIHDFNF